MLDNGFGISSTFFMIQLGNDTTYLDSIDGFYPFAEVVDGFDSLASATSTELEISDEE